MLKVPPEKRRDINDKNKWKTYKFEKLKDLQSKLMLVAGKAAQGKEQVDRFMEVSGEKSSVKTQGNTKSK